MANGSYPTAFNTILDPQLKDPYSIAFNVGFEHEMPGGFILRSSYVGRLGRRLLAQADASQLIDFKDPVSGQLMSQAFANITQQMRAGTPALSVTPQPFYENVMVPGTGPAVGVPNNTDVLSYYFGTYMARGDFADATQGIASLQPFGLGLPPNVGMAAQFAENTFYTNKGFSAYHGLLTTLHKNAGHGLQFDINYTWSHSIDNVSVIANSVASGGYGFICDALRPRECRANSDFDVTQLPEWQLHLRSAVWPWQGLWRDRTTLARRGDRRLDGKRPSQLAYWKYLLCGCQRVCGRVFQTMRQLFSSDPLSDVKTHI